MRAINMKYVSVTSGDCHDIAVEAQDHPSARTDTITGVPVQMFKRKAQMMKVMDSNHSSDIMINASEVTLIEIYLRLSTVKYSSESHSLFRGIPVLNFTKA